MLSRDSMSTHAENVTVITKLYLYTPIEYFKSFASIIYSRAAWASVESYGFPFKRQLVKLLKTESGLFSENYRSILGGFGSTHL